MILLTILLIFFLLFWIMVRFGPKILLAIIKRKSNKANKEAKRKEGEVFVSGDGPQRPEKIVEKNVGEYVDYEHIKEDK